MYSAFQNVLSSPVNNLTLSRPAALAMWSTDGDLCGFPEAFAPQRAAGRCCDAERRRNGEDDNIYVLGLCRVRASFLQSLQEGFPSGENTSRRVRWRGARISLRELVFARCYLAAINEQLSSLRSD